MFCGNCGSQNPDGLTKCAVCGAPLAEEKKAGEAGKLDLKSTDKNKLVGYGVIAAVALVVVILLIVLFSGRSDTSALKQYVKASFDLDGKKIVNLTPKLLVEVYADQEDISKGDAKDELIEDMENTLEDLDDEYDDIDFDEVKSIKVEIRKEDEYSKKQVRDFNENFEDLYDFELKAKAVKTVEIKVSGKYDGDKFDFKGVSVMLVKIGGSWYIMTPDPESLFSALSSEVG